MKKNLLLWSVLISSLVPFSSCTDEEFLENGNQPSNQNEGIAIGATAGYERDTRTDSRTIYPGNVVGNIEKINWVLAEEYAAGENDYWKDDQIRVYSEDAESPVAGRHYVDYKLVSHSQKNPLIYKELPRAIGAQAPDGGVLAPTDEGAFRVIGSETGLRWTDKPEHRFYAVYPTPELNPSVKFGDNKSLKFEGKISSSQAVVGYINDPVQPTTGKRYMALPIMRQNYMWAVCKANELDKVNNSISLDFRTIGTVLEVELVSPVDGMNLTNVLLSSDRTDVDLCGKFQADLSTVGTTGYPTVKLMKNEVGKIQNIINVNLDADPTDAVAGIVLNAGERLKVRFILLPEDLDGHELTLTVRGPNGQRSHKLASSAGTFKLQAHKINRLNNVKFPKDLIGTNWISLLDDRVLLSQLSIPGTGSSYLTTGDAKRKAQVKSIADQWNMGIRCFDITAGRNADDKVDDFGAVKLRVDKANTIAGQTVSQAFNLLLEQVQSANNGNEFGMMIVRYQPGSRQRDVQQFISDFEAYFGNLDKNRFCLYEPTKTVGEARGKIMVILCPSSEGEDNLDKVNAVMTNYLLVNGNGSLPDKFYKRGYHYQNTTINLKGRVTVKAGTGKLEWPHKYAEHYIRFKSEGKIYIGQEPDFSYKTNQTFDAWMQDWVRVIDENPAGGNTVVLKAENTNYTWPTSYNEKFDNVKQTFTKAIADAQGSRIYINSLCGFLVNEENRGLGEGQYLPLYGRWPAVAGNIKALADKLNPAFYQYMYDQLRTGAVKGPMGVVLMNFVGDETIAGSTLMPSMVISNNFSFPLKIKGSAATRGVNSSLDSNNTEDWF